MAIPAVPATPDFLPSHVLADTDDDTGGCFFARRADGGVLLLSIHKRLFTRSIGADGAPRTPATLEVGSVGAEMGLGAFKPVGEGYLAVWVEQAASNREVKMLALDAAGKPLAPMSLVAHIPDEVTSLDILPNATGALILWEVSKKESSKPDRSDLVVVPVIGGKVDGRPETVAQDVIGWEAEPAARGAALAMVLASPTIPNPKDRSRATKASRAMEAQQEKRASATGRVLFAQIDAKGKVGAPVVVSGESTAQVDVMLASVGGAYVLAWTDERNLDSAVFLAAVDATGKVVRPPQPATPPFGEEALVALVAAPYAPGAAPSKRALLAWERQMTPQGEGRTIHLATLGPDAALGTERATLTFATSGPPDIAPDGDGFAALTLAPLKRLPEGVVLADPKAAPPIWPAFVRFGPDLTVLASEPIRAKPFASSDGVPYLTRNLSCVLGSCTALGTGAPTHDPATEGRLLPAPVALVDLPVRQTPWAAPASRTGGPTPPRAVSVRALHDGDHLSRVGAAELANGKGLVAWVTYVLEVEPPGAGGKKKQGRVESFRGATVSTRVVAPDGALGASVVLTDKATSVGGVALAAGTAHDGKPQESAVAYVAREGKDPQVYVAKVGPNGEKLAQKPVTTVSRRPKKKGDGPSEASDVAIARLGGKVGEDDAWLTAWVDTRDGDAEVYAAKLDHNLGKVVSDLRITEAIGSAAEVQVATRGDDILLAWADARDDASEGNCDIYVAHLDAATLKKTAPETRLFASRGHSRTPQVLATAKGFIVSWIEEPTEGRAGTDPDAGLRVAELDEKGRIVGAPRLVHGADAGSSVTAASLACSSPDCRGVLTWEVGGALVLGAFELGPDLAPGPVKAIAGMTGPTAEDTSPTLMGPSGASLFFMDDSITGSGRVRWMRIQWR